MKYPVPGKLDAEHLTPDQLEVVADAAGILVLFHQRFLKELSRAGVQWPDRAAIVMETLVYAGACVASGVDEAQNEFSDPEAFQDFAAACFAVALTRSGADGKARQ